MAIAWGDIAKACKLATLLEGEALAVWLELSAEQQGDYKVAKKEIVFRTFLCYQCNNSDNQSNHVSARFYSYVLYNYGMIIKCAES